MHASLALNRWGLDRKDIDKEARVIDQESESLQLPKGGGIFSTMVPSRTLKSHHTFNTNDVKLNRPLDILALDYEVFTQ